MQKKKTYFILNDNGAKIITISPLGKGMRRWNTFKSKEEIQFVKRKFLQAR